MNLDSVINKITCGDSLEIMKQLPDESIDLVVTSPPYNLKNSTGNGMPNFAFASKSASNNLDKSNLFVAPTR